ncbi:MAG: hypothetical protein AAFX94_17890, partial [Myxococcota bacterium]
MCIDIYQSSTVTKEEAVRLNEAAGQAVDTMRTAPRLAGGKRKKKKSKRLRRVTNVRGARQHGAPGRRRKRKEDDMTTALALKEGGLDTYIGEINRIPLLS